MPLAGDGALRHSGVLKRDTEPRLSDIPGYRGVWRVMAAFCRNSLRRIFARGRAAAGGQMMVELAVTIPVLLAVVGISVNLMVFLGDCARFDRVAAEAVRTEAASPGFGSYGTMSRAQAVRARIENSFAGRSWLSFEVRASEDVLLGGGTGGGSTENGSSGNGSVDGSGGGSGGDSAGAASSSGFSFLPHQEEFVCVMRYRPWGFGESFFGIRFGGIEHTRVYRIDPYRPGVFL